MGGKGSQIIEDPNANLNQNQNQNQNNTKQNQQQQMLQIIKEAFRNCSQHGVLSKDKFNQALSILQALGFKRLRDTPLADRLFHIFDTSNTGTIVQTQFIKGISDIIIDNQNAISYTFKAYDRDRDNFVSRREFMLFIEDSWKAAFRLLSEGIDQKNMGVKIANIQSWTASKTSLLNQESSKLFSKISNGNDRVDYQAFRAFILKGQINDITAEIDGKKALVPLTLTNLH